MTSVIPPPAQAERATLYFREGSSDKVYHLALEAKDDGYVVTFAFGRRGGTLATGRKTTGPVSYAQARQIYDRLLKEKTAKGYTPGECGTPFQQTPQGQRDTGIRPQLLNPIAEADVAALIASDDWWMQPKYDGQRVLIRKSGEQVTGINRCGLTIALPQPLVDAVRQIPASHGLLDGELVGSVYHGFDLLARGETDLRPLPYAARHDAALNLLDAVRSDALRYADTATQPATKQKLYDRLKAADAEGVVFKQRLAPYTPGRPAHGGTQLKCKFWTTVSCIVAQNPGAESDRRSVPVELYDTAGQRVPVGRVSIPSNVPVPQAGAVIEVRYLYACPGGSLYQPVFIHRRDDVLPVECSVGQLKYKPAGPNSHH
jgi:bifunctional non-homologous end joining protein LigD